MKNNHLPVKARFALAAGNLREAYALMNKHYSITGIVVHGQQIGRVLGFPTANLKLTENSPVLLANGVYAVTVSLNNQVYNGMANVGIRPTLNNPVFTIEVNLFDFSGDLYGKLLKISFIDRIRSEKKFSGLDELKSQITLDKVKAEEILFTWSEPDSHSI